MYTFVLSKKGFLRPENFDYSACLPSNELYIAWLFTQEFCGNFRHAFVRKEKHLLGVFSARGKVHGKKS